MDNPFAQQQKILLYVFPLIFAVSGVNFPVGVLLYWLTTNLWTMGQQFYVIRRNPAPGSPAFDALEKRKAEKAARVKPTRPPPPTAAGTTDRRTKPASTTPRPPAPMVRSGRRASGSSRAGSRSASASATPHPAPVRAPQPTVPTTSKDDITDDRADRRRTRHRLITTTGVTDEPVPPTTEPRRAVAVADGDQRCRRSGTDRGRGWRPRPEPRAPGRA